MNLDQARQRGSVPPPSWIPCIFDNKLELSGNPQDYWQGSSFMIKMFAAAYQRHLPQMCKGGLVDLGCGPAPLLSAYRSWVDWYYLVDWPSSLHDNRYLDQALDLNAPLDIPDSTFDTAILTSVLEHIRHPDELLKECARILRPDGQLFMQVPFAYWLHEEPYDFFRYTRHGLSALVQGAGLQLVTIEAVGNDCDVMIDILSKRLCSSSWSIVRRAGRVLQSCMKTRANKAPDTEGRTKLPLGYVVIARKSA